MPFVMLSMGCSTILDRSRSSRDPTQLHLSNLAVFLCLQHLRPKPLTLSIDPNATTAIKKKKTGRVRIQENFASLNIQFF
jgi:hypothetical protein